MLPRAVALCASLLVASYAQPMGSIANVDGNLVMRTGSSFTIMCPEMTDDLHLACKGEGVEVRDGACAPTVAPCTGNAVEVDPEGNCVVIANTPASATATEAHVATALAEAMRLLRLEIASKPTAMPGMIQMWAAAQGAPPDGWLFCDGRMVAIAAYPELHGAIGFMYGAGGVAGTNDAEFALPDFRARFARGSSDGVLPGAVGGHDALTPSGAVSTVAVEGKVSTTILGETGGHALTLAQMPMHNHARGSNGYGWAGSNAYAGADHGGSNAFQPPFNGEDQPHSHGLSGVQVESTFEGDEVTPTFTGEPMATVPAYQAVHYIIKY